MAAAGPDSSPPPDREDRTGPTGDPEGPGPGSGRWIVDGNNVMGSRPDGWWRDRAGAATRLVSQLAGVPRPAVEELVVVFDGPPRAGGPGPGAVGIEVLYAGTAGSADDTIVSLVAAQPGRPTTVFTSDAELAGRVRAEGARVSGARSLLDRISSEEGSVSRRPRAH